MSNGHRLSQQMKITSWNVNGIRARLTHVVDFLRNEEPDVLCLQETKVVDESFPIEALEDEGYDVSFYGQKSYNGVAILAQHEIEQPFCGMPDDPEDAEKRVIGATVKGVRVLDLYVPNGQDVGTDKYEFKLDWMRRLRAFLDASFSAGEPLAVVGDFNVTLDDRDVHDPDWWRDRILCSDRERQAMRSVMAFGLDDTLRLHHTEGGIYTWWHYRAGAAFADEGMRIDYVLTTPPLTARCRAVTVHKDLRLAKSPSDHAPVTAEFDDAP